AFGCALLVPALARAQTAPPAAPAAPPAASVDPAAAERLEKRIAELEARVAAAERKAAPSEEKKKEETKPEAKESAPKEPFAFADFSWVPGNYGASEKPLSWGPFTGELRVDTTYHYNFANPKDN